MAKLAVKIKSFKQVKRCRKGRQCTRCNNTALKSCNDWHRVLTVDNFYEFLCPSCSSENGIPVSIWAGAF